MTRRASGTSSDDGAAGRAVAASAVERPVVIVGTLPSHSTLLRLTLDAHPDVHVFREFEKAVSQAKDHA